MIWYVSLSFQELGGWHVRIHPDGHFGTATLLGTNRSRRLQVPVTNKHMPLFSCKIHRDHGRVPATNIPHQKSLLKMIFLFLRWDMLVSGRVPFTGALLSILSCPRFSSKSTEVVLMRDTPRWYYVVHITDAFLTTFSSLTQNLNTKQRNQLHITLSHME